MKGTKGIFIGVDHPAVAAEDVEGLAKWYCEMFDYEIFGRHPKPAVVLIAPDRTCLEIIVRDKTERPVRTTWTPGWSHLALRVSNLESAIRELDEKGVNWTGEITNAIGGGRLRNLSDPEGNMLQILEREF